MHEDVYDAFAADLVRRAKALKFGDPLVDDTAVFAKFLAVPEEAGAHVVLLGDNRLLMAASAPQTAEVFRGLGYQPVVVDISEFEKLEGCVTCLSVRLR